MTKTSKLFAGTLALCLPAVASADDYILGDTAMDFTVGAGMVGFVDQDTRDYAATGGMWEARLGFNTNQYVGFEAGYVGTWQAIDALGLDSDAALLGTSVEGNVRVNFMKGAIQPYAHVGAGYTRYSLTASDFNTSDVADHDDAAHLPMGIGLTYRDGNILVDLRGTFRTTTRNDLISNVDAPLDAWTATAKAGYAF